jgi:hypothetical protein
LTNSVKFVMPVALLLNTMIHSSRVAKIVHSVLDHALMLMDYSRFLELFKAISGTEIFRLAIALKVNILIS